MLKLISVLKKQCFVVFVLASGSAFACMERLREIKPFGATSPYLQSNKLEFSSMGIRIDGDLIYFSSETKSWELRDRNGAVTRLAAPSMLNIVDDSTKAVTGVIRLEASRNGVQANAVLTPSTSGIRRPPPKIYYTSGSLEAGVREQSLKIVDHMNVVQSTLGIRRADGTKSAMPISKGINLESSEEALNVQSLDLAATPGHYMGSGCGSLTLRTFGNEATAKGGLLKEGLIHKSGNK